MIKFFSTSAAIAAVLLALTGCSTTSSLQNGKQEQVAIVGSSANVADQAPQEVVQTIQAKFPNTRIKEVRKAPIDGLYEIVMGSNVAYADSSARYLIFGHLWDSQAQVDLTAQRKVEAKKSEFPSQFLQNAIKTVKGDGSRVFAVFSDPDCPYCRKLESELARMDNVTIYTFLFPLETLHPEAKTKSIAVWCSADRGRAWSQAVMTGVAPQLVACANPVNDNLVLGTRLGVTGTPTLISLDGRILPGAVPAEKLDQWLGSSGAAARSSP